MSGAARASEEMLESVDDELGLRELIGLAHRCFTRRLSGSAEIDECVSTTMYLVWRKHERGNSVDAAHMYAVARGVLSNARRTSSRRRKLLEKATLRSLISAEEVSDESDVIDLLVESLRTSELEILLLVAWEGLTLKEVATVLGIRDAAARKRYGRARAKAQEALRGQGVMLPGPAANVSEALP